MHINNFLLKWIRGARVHAYVVVCPFAEANHNVRLHLVFFTSTLQRIISRKTIVILQLNENKSVHWFLLRRPLGICQFN